MYKFWKPHLVLVGERYYAVRRWTLFGWQYRDLVCPQYWWNKDNRQFKECLTQAKEVAEFYCMKEKRIKE